MHAILKSQKLNSFKFSVSNLDFVHQNFSVNSENHHIGCNLALDLLRLEGDDQVVLSVGDELAAAESVGGNLLANRDHLHVSKVLVSNDHGVGPHLFVRNIIILVWTHSPG